MTLTSKQAYELALDVRKSFEDKWSAYVKEDAKRSVIFDEEDA